LNGKVFQGVDGFFAKYFEDRSWAAAVQTKLQEPKSAEVVRKLAAAALDLAHFDALAEWLATFRGRPAQPPLPQPAAQQAS
jgi:hypothetical protein